jgi:hypothetical protein
VDFFVVSYEEDICEIQIFGCDDLHAIEIIGNTLEFLCDVEVVMRPTCIMLMLEALHELIKFVQVMTHKYAIYYFQGWWY